MSELHNFIGKDATLLPHLNKAPFIEKNMPEITEKLNGVYVAQTVSAPLKRELNEGMLPLYDLEATVLTAKQDTDGLHLWLNIPKIHRTIPYQHQDRASIEGVLAAGNAKTPEELTSKPVRAYITAGLAPVGITADSKRKEAIPEKKEEAPLSLGKSIRKYLGFWIYNV